jgi:hypothetical protein
MSNGTVLKSINIRFVASNIDLATPFKQHGEAYVIPVCNLTAKRPFRHYQNRQGMNRWEVSVSSRAGGLRSNLQRKITAHD